MRVLVCTQQSWGVAAYELVQQLAPRHQWQLYDAVCDGRVAGLRAVLDSQALRPDYAFFLGWSQRVPNDILARTECVNFHCTRLPYGRGGAPIENLIIRGHRSTTLTAHRMVEELDAGPVYMRDDFIWLAGTKNQILARMVAPCAFMMRDIVTRQPPAVPQDGKPTYFKRLSPALYEEFWKLREDDHG